MADQVLEVEARLRDYISANLDKLEGRLQVFGTKAVETNTKVTKSSDEVGTSFGKLPEKFGGAVKMLGAVAGVAGVATIAFNKFMESVNFASNIEDMSNRLGVTTDEFQRLSVIARDGGVDAGSMGIAFKTLNKQIVENGSALRQLNIQTKTSNGSQREASDIMKEASLALNNITSEAQKSAIAMELFGRGGMDVLQIMRRNKDAFAETTESMRKNGLILSEQAVRDLDIVGDAWDRFGTKVKVVSAAVAAGVVNAFTGGPIAERIKKEVDDIAKLQGQIDDLKAKGKTYSFSTGSIDNIQSRIDSAYSSIRQLRKMAGMTETMGPPAPSNDARTTAVLTAEQIKIGEKYIEDALKASHTGRMELLKRQEEEAMSVYKGTAYEGSITSYFSSERVAENKKYAAEMKTISDKALADAKDSGDGQEALDKELQAQRDKRWEKQKQQGVEKMKLAKDVSDAEIAEIDRSITADEKAAQRKRDLLGSQVTTTIGATRAIMDLGRRAVESSRMDATKQKGILRAMAIADAAGAAVSGVYSVWKEKPNPWVGIAETAIVVASILGATIGQIRAINNAQFARGTRSAPGGMALVGERGPELVNLPMGSTVYNNSETRNLMQNTNTGNTTLNVTVHASSGPAETLRMQMRKGEAQGFIRDLRREMKI